MVSHVLCFEFCFATFLVLVFGAFLAHAFELTESNSLDFLVLKKNFTFLLSKYVRVLILVCFLFLWVPYFRLAARLFKELSTGHFVASQMHIKAWPDFSKRYSLHLDCGLSDIVALQMSKLDRLIFPTARKHYDPF